jgi:hypothetical protein
MTFEHHCPVPHDVHPAFRLVSADDWRAMLRTRANVLVTGPEDALEAFVRAARTELCEPIRSMMCGQALSLDSASTLILRDVHQLDDVGQRTLREWVNRPEHAATQVVSVTSVPLFASARTNRFDRDLYYCLNTIYLEVGPTDREHPYLT